MDWLGAVLAFLKQLNFFGAVGVITAVLHVAIAIAMIFPGDQPEKFLQSIVDWIAAHSN